MYCIISTNSNLETVAWGPFKTLAEAKKARRILKSTYPKPSHLVLPFQDYNEVRKEHNIKYHSK
jgi:hypothetical protein